MGNEKVTISLDLANAVLGYLGKRPYEEVFQLVERFQGEHKEAVAASAEAEPKENNGTA